LYAIVQNYPIIIEYIFIYNNNNTRWSIKMAKFIKSKFRVLWGTVFSFFAGMFMSTSITAQEA
jgi:hypothetical protein